MYDCVVMLAHQITAERLDTFVYSKIDIAADIGLVFKAMERRKFPLGRNRFQLKRLALLKDLRADFCRVAPGIRTLTVLGLGIGMKQRKGISCDAVTEI